LNRGCYQKAWSICMQLSAVTSTNSDISSNIDARYKRALVMFHDGRLVEASMAINTLITECKSRGLELQTVEYLLKLAEIHMKAKSPITALFYVLKCLTLCQNYHLDAVEAKAKVVLAEIHLLQFNSPTKATALIEKVLPQILQHTDLYWTSKTYLLLTKCLIGTPNFNLAKSASNILDLLGRAEIGMQKMEAIDQLIEIYYLKARLYHQLNQPKQRDEAARLFRLTTEQKTRAEYAPINGTYYCDVKSLQNELSTTKKL